MSGRLSTDPLVASFVSSERDYIELLGVLVLECLEPLNRICDIPSPSTSDSHASLPVTEPPPARFARVVRQFTASLPTLAQHQLTLHSHLRLRTLTSASHLAAARALVTAFSPLLPTLCDAYSAFASELPLLLPALGQLVDAQDADFAVSNVLLTAVEARHRARYAALLSLPSPAAAGTVRSSSSGTNDDDESDTTPPYINNISSSSGSANHSASDTPVPFLVAALRQPLARVPVYLALFKSLRTRLAAAAAATTASTPTRSAAAEEDDGDETSLETYLAHTDVILASLEALAGYCSGFEDDIAAAIAQMPSASSQNTSSNTTHGHGHGHALSGSAASHCNNSINGQSAYSRSRGSVSNSQSDSGNESETGVGFRLPRRPLLASDSPDASASSSAGSSAAHSQSDANLPGHSDGDSDGDVSKAHTQALSRHNDASSRHGDIYKTSFIPDPVPAGAKSGSNTNSASDAGCSRRGSVAGGSTAGVASAATASAATEAGLGGLPLPTVTPDTDHYDDHNDNNYNEDDHGYNNGDYADAEEAGDHGNYGYDNEDDANDALQREREHAAEASNADVGAANYSSLNASASAKPSANTAASASRGHNRAHSINGPASQATAAVAVGGGDGVDAADGAYGGFNPPAPAQSSPSSRYASPVKGRSREVTPTKDADSNNNNNNSSSASAGAGAGRTVVAYDRGNHTVGYQSHGHYELGPNSNVSEFGNVYNDNGHDEAVAAAAEAAATDAEAAAAAALVYAKAAAASANAASASVGADVRVSTPLDGAVSGKATPVYRAPTPVAHTHAAAHGAVAGASQSATPVAPVASVAPHTPGSISGRASASANAAAALTAPGLSASRPQPQPQAHTTHSGSGHGAGAAGTYTGAADTYTAADRTYTSTHAHASAPVPATGDNAVVAPRRIVIGVYTNPTPVPAAPNAHNNNSSSSAVVNATQQHQQQQQPQNGHNIAAYRRSSLSSSTGTGSGPNSVSDAAAAAAAAPAPGSGPVSGTHTRSNSTLTGPNSAFADSQHTVPVGSHSRTNSTLSAAAAVPGAHHSRTNSTLTVSASPSAGSASTGSVSTATPATNRVYTTTTVVPSAAAAAANNAAANNAAAYTSTAATTVASNDRATPVYSAPSARATPVAAVAAPGPAFGPTARNSSNNSINNGDALATPASMHTSTAPTPTNYSSRYFAASSRAHDDAAATAYSGGVPSGGTGTGTGVTIGGGAAASEPRRFPPAPLSTTAHVGAGSGAGVGSGASSRRTSVATPRVPHIHIASSLSGAAAGSPRNASVSATSPNATTAALSAVAAAALASHRRASAPSSASTSFTEAAGDYSLPQPQAQGGTGADAVAAAAGEAAAAAGLGEDALVRLLMEAVKQQMATSDTSARGNNHNASMTGNEFADVDGVGNVSTVNVSALGDLNAQTNNGQQKQPNATNGSESLFGLNLPGGFTLPATLPAGLVDLVTALTGLAAVQQQSALLSNNNGSSNSNSADGGGRLSGAGAGAGLGAMPIQIAATIVNNNTANSHNAHTATTNASRTDSSTHTRSDNSSRTDSSSRTRTGRSSDSSTHSRVDNSTHTKAAGSHNNTNHGAERVEAAGNGAAVTDASAAADATGGARHAPRGNSSNNNAAGSASVVNPNIAAGALPAALAPQLGYDKAALATHLLSNIVNTHPALAQAHLPSLLAALAAFLNNKEGTPLVAEVKPPAGGKAPKVKLTVHGVPTGPHSGSVPVTVSRSGEAGDTAARAASAAAAATLSAAFGGPSHGASSVTTRIFPANYTAIGGVVGGDRGNDAYCTKRDKKDKKDRCSSAASVRDNCPYLASVTRVHNDASAHGHKGAKETRRDRERDSCERPADCAHAHGHGYGHGHHGHRCKGTCSGSNKDDAELNHYERSACLPSRFCAAAAHGHPAVPATATAAEVAAADAAAARASRQFTDALVSARARATATLNADHVSVYSNGNNNAAAAVQGRDSRFDALMRPTPQASPATARDGPVFTGSHAYTQANAHAQSQAQSAALLCPRSLGIASHGPGGCPALLSSHAAGCNHNNSSDDSASVDRDLTMIADNAVATAAATAPCLIPGQQYGQLHGNSNSNFGNNGGFKVSLAPNAGAGGSLFSDSSVFSDDSATYTHAHGNFNGNNNNNNNMHMNATTRAAAAALPQQPVAWTVPTSPSEELFALATAGYPIPAVTAPRAHSAAHSHLTAPAAAAVAAANGRLGQSVPAVAPASRSAFVSNPPATAPSSLSTPLDAAPVPPITQHTLPPGAVALNRTRLARARADADAAAAAAEQRRQLARAAAARAQEQVGVDLEVARLAATTAAANSANTNTYNSTVPSVSASANAAVGALEAEAALAAARARFQQQHQQQQQQQQQPQPWPPRQQQPHQLQYGAGDDSTDDSLPLSPIFSNACNNAALRATVAGCNSANGAYSSSSSSSASANGNVYYAQAPAFASFAPRVPAPPQWFPASTFASTAADDVPAKANAYVNNTGANAGKGACPYGDPSIWAIFAPAPAAAAPAPFAAAAAASAPAPSKPITVPSFANAATDTAVTYPVAVALPLKLGLALTHTPNNRGCYVKALAPQSVAAAVGVAVGDRVVYVNNRLTRSLSEFSWAMDMAAKDVSENGGNVVAVQFARGENTRLILYLPVAI